MLMRMIAEAAAVPVDPVEAVGWRGDFLEAEAFAYPRRPRAARPAAHLADDHRRSAGR